MRVTKRLTRSTKRLPRLVLTLILALVSPLMEKHPLKSAPIRGRRLPFVFSMARLVVLAFAVAMLHQAWLAGIVGWPDATLSIAIVLALPLLGALERTRAQDTIALARALFGRFGIGTTRHAGSIFTREPSKYDDHRDDDREAA